MKMLIRSQDSTISPSVSLVSASSITCSNNESKSWLLMLLLLSNDVTIGWQKLNLPSHSNATLAPQAWQARASGEILNYSLSHLSDILK